MGNKKNRRKKSNSTELDRFLATGSVAKAHSSKGKTQEVSEHHAHYGKGTKRHNGTATGASATG